MNNQSRSRNGLINFTLIPMGKILSFSCQTFRLTNGLQEWIKFENWGSTPFSLLCFWIVPCTHGQNNYPQTETESVTTGACGLRQWFPKWVAIPLGLGGKESLHEGTARKIIIIIIILNVCITLWKSVLTRSMALFYSSFNLLHFVPRPLPANRLPSHAPNDTHLHIVTLISLLFATLPASLMCHRYLLLRFVFFHHRTSYLGSHFCLWMIFLSTALLNIGSMFIKVKLLLFFNLHKKKNPFVFYNFVFDSSPFKPDFLLWFGGIIKKVLRYSFINLKYSFSAPHFKGLDTFEAGTVCERRMSLIT